MADAEIVTTQITGDVSQFIRSMDAAGKSALELKRHLLDLVSTANDFEKAFNAMKSQGLKVNIKVDTSGLDRAESDIKAMDGSSVNVDVTADTARAETRIKSLEDATNRVKVPVEADTSRAESDIQSLGGERVTAKVDGDTSAIEAKLDAIRNLAVIDVVLNIVEGGGEGVPILGGVIGRDAAAGALAARTGMGEAESAAAIEEVYKNAYGASAEEIANNIALVEQLDVQTGTLASNTAIAWDTANIAQEDFANTLEVMDKLVKTGLVADFQEASDVIVGGIQAGANRSGDFLDTLREYSSVFEQGGYSAESAINLMVQALEAGTFNTDKLGDTVKENILKINEALGDVGGTGGTARPILEKFDLLDDAALIGQAEEAGGITAEEFAARFLETLTTEFEAGNIDLTEFNFAVAEVFGTPVEDLGFDIFKSLDFAAAAESEGTFEGLGAEAAEQINNNLGTAFTGLGRTIELEIVDTLAQAGFDLNAILDTAKEKVTEIGALIRSGVAIPEALEITLQMPGLAATLHGIESTMGNVYLAFLDIIAKVQDLGGDTGGAEATRGLIAEGGARQLAFDIKLAGDADDVLRLLDIAEGRGVDPAAIGTAVSGAATELINQGDLDRAQQLLDIVNELPNAVVKIPKFGINVPPVEVPIFIDPNATQEEIDAAVAVATEQFMQNAPSGGYIPTDAFIDFSTAIDVSDAQSYLDSEVGELRDQFDTAMDSHNWVDAFDIAKRLNDEGGMEMARDQMRQTGEDIAQAFADGIELLNPFAERESPIGFISDMEAQASNTIPEWRAEINRTPSALLNMGITASEAAGGVAELDETVGDTDLTVSIFAETVLATLSNARDSMATYTPEIITWLDQIRDASIEAGNALGKVTVPGGTTPGTGRGGGGGNGSGAGGAPVGGVPSSELKPSAEGGLTSGWGLVGEQGAEVIWSDDSMAVWNNNTTAAFMAGLQVSSDMIFDSGAGFGSTYNDNRTFNVNTSNINHGAAARGASDQRVANAVRGMG